MADQGTGEIHVIPGSLRKGMNRTNFTNPQTIQPSRHSALADTG